MRAAGPRVGERRSPAFLRDSAAARLHCGACEGIGHFSGVSGDGKAAPAGPRAVAPA